ncbi:hypothetical protein Pelo_16519 [Pelomyxa schiedti]|nr:hypothetical protein Pelo_16519 [Pelomyxa schiedti]
MTAFRSVDIGPSVAKPRPRVGGRAGLRLVSASASVSPSPYRLAVPPPVCEFNRGRCKRVDELMNAALWVNVLLVSRLCACFITIVCDSGNKKKSTLRISREVALIPTEYCIHLSCPEIFCEHLSLSLRWPQGTQHRVPIRSHLFPTRTSGTQAESLTRSIWSCMSGRSRDRSSCTGFSVDINLLPLEKTRHLQWLGHISPGRFLGQTAR